MEARALVRHEAYAADRQAALGALDLLAVDPPIVDIVEAFNQLPYCFTLQCCYGHLLTAQAQDDHSMTPVPDGYDGPVRYRIAYVAFCIEADDRGRAFLERLSRVPGIEPASVQFGCAEWFWDQWPNSYVLQVWAGGPSGQGSGDAHRRRGAADAVRARPLLRTVAEAARRRAHFLFALRRSTR